MASAWGLSFGKAWGFSFGMKVSPVGGNEVKFIEIRSFTDRRRI
jgi:hypothetical protein